MPRENDNVKTPAHYDLNLNGVESIDVVRAVLGDEGFRKHCRGCALKYLMRADKKNGLEDLKKAQHHQWALAIKLRERAENKSAHEEKWEQKNAINIDGVALHR